MSAETWIKFYPTAWLHGTRGLTAVERGVYITLLALMYDEQGPIKANRKLLARECKMTQKAFDEAFDSLLELGKLTIENDELFNEKTGKILSELFQRGERARKGGVARSEKAKEKQGEASAQAENKQEDSSATGEQQRSASSAIIEERRKIKEASKLATHASAREASPPAEAPPEGKGETEEALRRAAGWYHASPRLSFTQPIDELIAKGLDLEADVVPIVRQLAPTAKGRANWNFFVGPLTDALARKLAKAPESKSPAEGAPEGPRQRYVVVIEGTDQWDAWFTHMRRTTGKGPPLHDLRDENGKFLGRGWRFASLWPPGHPNHKPETEEAA